MQLPFCQKLKRKIVIREVEGDDTQVRVYVKGAPELIIPLCVDTLNEQGDLQELNDGEKEYIIFDQISNQMACNELKTISFAYKQIPRDDLEMLMKSYDVESDEFRNEIEADLVYVCTFGLTDEVRDDVKDQVELLRYGRVGIDVEDLKDSKNQVNIRLVSGDHFDTCKQVAIKSGILTEAEARIKGVILSGDSFRTSLGKYERILDEKSGKMIYQFMDNSRKKDVIHRVRVIARATDDDKQLLIAAIKEEGGLVMMSGQTIADATALKEANIGVCMGTNCQVAYDNSDLVILD